MYPCVRTWVHWYVSQLNCFTQFALKLLFLHSKNVLAHHWSDNNSISKRHSSGRLIQIFFFFFRSVHISKGCSVCSAHCVSLAYWFDAVVTNLLFISCYFSFWISSPVAKYPLKKHHQFRFAVRIIIIWFLSSYLFLAFSTYFVFLFQFIFSDND